MTIVQPQEMPWNVIYIWLFPPSPKDMMLWIPTWVIVNFHNIINPFVLHQVMHATLMLQMMKGVLVHKILNLLHFFLSQKEKWNCIRATKSADCSKKTYFTKALSMPTIMVCSGLIVDTALDIYIPSGIAQHDSECRVELDNRIATKGKRTRSEPCSEFQSAHNELSHEGWWEVGNKMLLIVELNFMEHFLNLVLISNQYHWDNSFLKECLSEFVVMMVVICF